MSTSNGNNPITRSGAAAAEAAPLAPEQFIEQLRTMRQQIPEYVQLTAAEKRVLRRLNLGDPHFVQTAIHLLGTADGVQQAIGKVPDQLRLDADEDKQWRTVVDEVKALLKGVVAANLVRRHRLALAVQQTYQISRQIVRSNAELLPLVEGMQQMKRASRKRGKTTPPPVVESTAK
jgi:hypothetical protein